MSTVVGLDLSLTSTGYAVVGDNKRAVGTVTSKGKAGATLAERNSRLTQIVKGIDDVGYLADDADLFVIEAPAYSRSNPGMHDRSGLWWLAVRHLVDLGYPVVEVAPSARAKYATGKGNASKDQVLAAVVRRYPDFDVTSNDEADALILAAMGCRALGQPIDDMPQAHLAGMSKVAWPTHIRQTAMAAAPF